MRKNLAFSVYARRHNSELVKEFEDQHVMKESVAKQNTPWHFKEDLSLRVSVPKHG